MAASRSFNRAASIGVRVARGLHERWDRLGGPERTRLEDLADEVKNRALDLRGARDSETADQRLSEASERLATAMVDSARSDPEVSDAEVEALRDDLAAELGRVASGRVTASRTAPVPDPTAAVRHIRR